MISGLKGAAYGEKLAELSLTTLEERRHQTDMLQTLKILRGFDRVSSDTWFQRVDTSVRTTRSAADPLNLKPQPARLDIRRNFFSNRVTEPWNLIPSELKNAKTGSFFKRAYPTRGTEWKWWEPPNKNLRSDPARGETHSRNRISPKRFYLDHRRPTHKKQEMSRCKYK
jgi:hypothetical protein